MIERHHYSLSFIRANLHCLLLFRVFVMTGDEQVNSPKDFNECISRAQLQAAMEDA
jgi:hypothetical protein